MVLPLPPALPFACRDVHHVPLSLIGLFRDKPISLPFDQGSGHRTLRLNAPSSDIGSSCRGLLVADGMTAPVLIASCVRASFGLAPFQAAVLPAEAQVV